MPIRYQMSRQILVFVLNYLPPEISKKRAKPFRLSSYLAMALRESENFLLNSIGQGGSEKRPSISALSFLFGESYMLTRIPAACRSL